MPDQSRNLPHLHLEGGGQREAYRSPRLTTRGLPPPRVRAEHASDLEIAAGAALAAARARLSERDQSIAEGEAGFYLEFSIKPDQKDAIEALESKRSGIELVAVKPSVNGPPTEQELRATVFVPERAAEFFAQKIEQYRDEETRFGKPKHEALIARIEDINIGAAFSLYTGDLGLFPDVDKTVWWEVWLRDGKFALFESVSSRLGIAVKAHKISFPERDVALAFADISQLEKLIINSDAVAELRIANDTPAPFLEMGPKEQSDWMRGLVDRVLPPTGSAPAVCLLDSGVTQGHPLIAPALVESDVHAYDPNWPKADVGKWNGHGTAMAGVIIYGDLYHHLMSKDPVHLFYRLESVKILPPSGENEPELYGSITEEAVKIVESAQPERLRAFCMATTSKYETNRGHPSSWSAAIDKLCYGIGDRRRFMVMAAGNIHEDILGAEYPDRNDASEIQNPAQAWNALVVGAYTEKTILSDPSYTGWMPVAPAGELSPVSRTSVAWDTQWPVRPDVVLEGGNLAHDGTNPADAAVDLQLLSTHYKPSLGLYRPFGATSAATALGANMAAQIMAARPELWPETIRALIVQSADWTPRVRAQIVAAKFLVKRALLRRYGWGVPNIDHALKSTRNDATLMIEDVLLPFRKDGGDIKTQDMNVHELPWPKDELLSLGDQSVELRITLSYFIEPNPGERGWVRRHRYASHGLRFAVKRSLERLQDFRERINKAAAAEELGRRSPTSGQDHWILGPLLRDRGSIHSDIWRGTAAELAERDAIGIFPIGGWWKEKAHLHRWERSARYALVVTIRAPGSDVDIYTAIANKIGVPIPAA